MSEATERARELIRHTYLGGGMSEQSEDASRVANAALDHIDALERICEIYIVDFYELEIVRIARRKFEEAINE